MSSLKIVKFLYIKNELTVGVRWEALIGCSYVDSLLLVSSTLMQLSSFQQHEGGAGRGRGEPHSTPFICSAATSRHTRCVACVSECESQQEISAVVVKS